jgi:hypothetical protein
MVCDLIGRLNEQPPICKKKLFHLWIKCVYLLVNLWLFALPAAGKNVALEVCGLAQASVTP